MNLHQRNREKKKEIRKPENLNPLGMDEEKIPQGIVDGSIHVGPPPEGRSCNSPNWNQGMAFLFFSEDDEEVTNWYVCTICAKMFNTWLQFGTTNMTNHLITKHINNEYRITKQELAKALHTVWLLAKGTEMDILPETFEKILPKDSW